MFVQIFKDSNLLFTGLLSAFLFFCIITVSALFVLLKINLSLALPAAIILAFAVTAFCRYRLLGLNFNFPVVVCLTLAIYFIAVVLNGFLYDISIDGRVHFQEQVIQLGAGWNSFTTSFKYGPDWWGYIWCEHYPLGMAFYEVAFYKLFGMQCAKNHTFVLLAASILIILPYLKSIMPKWAAWLVTLTMALNPLMVMQFWSFYIDGAIYAVILIGIGCLFYLAQDNRKQEKYLYAVLISMVIWFLPTFKLSCGIFSALLLIFYLAVCFRQKRFLIPFLCLIPVIILVAYRPFLSHNIFETLEVMKYISSSNTLPVEMNDKSVIVAYSMNYIYWPTPSWAPINKTFNSQFVYYDSSYALYGIIWFIFLLFSIYYMYALRKNKPAMFTIGVFIVISIVPLFFQILMNQRYYPLVYFFPFVVIIFAFKYHKVKKYGLYGMGVILFCHLTLICSYIYIVTYENISFTKPIRREIAKVEAKSREYDGVLFFDFDIWRENGFDQGWWHRDTLSDRLWVEGKADYYIPRHYMNQISLPDRFEQGALLLECDNVNKKELELELSPHHKHLGIRIDFTKALPMPRFVLIIVSDRLDGNFEPGFLTNFIRIVDSGEKQVMFELPVYTKKIYIWNILDMDSIEIREIEIQKPVY